MIAHVFAWMGDRLDTDVLFGKDNGLKSLLVLSGVTTEDKTALPGKQNYAGLKCRYHQ